MVSVCRMSKLVWYIDNLNFHSVTGQKWTDNGQIKVKKKYIHLYEAVLLKWLSFKVNRVVIPEVIMLIVYGFI